ncbi:MAG: manganese transporter [Spirochaetaceae bacterium]|nr:MAG: manganese transporter [Spirochaetaceae bacterium]
MTKKPLFSVAPVALLLCLSLPLYAGGGRESPPAGREGQLNIVATTGMIGDVVRNVAGDLATVHTLMGEDIDPHLFRPTRADVARMQAADIIFYNGLLLEGRMGDSLVQIGRTKPVFAVSERVDESLLLDDEEYEEAFDPHLWMDVSLWMKAVDVVADALAEIDPRNAGSFRANATAYRAELETLDAYVRRIAATVPAERRVLITAHDAFGYFGNAYGFEVRGVQGMSTESEAGLDDVNSLVSFVVERGISAVFAETTVPDRALSAVIEGAAARQHRVEIGGELFSDAMGAPGTYEGTYIGMIDHNATTIVRALGGSAPERGLHGRLGQ